MMMMHRKVGTPVTGTVSYKNGCNMLLVLFLSTYKFKCHSVVLDNSKKIALTHQFSKLIEKLQNAS